MHTAPLMVKRQPRVMFSSDGRTWTPPRRVLSEGEWLWRVTWHGRTAYGVIVARGQVLDLPWDVFESALTFARCEGTIPAPESAHAIHSVVQHARRARESGERPVILFNLSGHGIFDLTAYDSFLSGTMRRTS